MSPRANAGLKTGLVRASLLASFAACAVFGCGSTPPRDQNYGTNLGADFVAPVIDAGSDGAGGEAGAASGEGGSGTGSAATGGAATGGAATGGDAGAAGTGVTDLAGADGAAGAAGAGS